MLYAIAFLEIRSWRTWKPTSLQNAAWVYKVWCGQLLANTVNRGVDGRMLPDVFSISGLTATVREDGETRFVTLNTSIGVTVAMFEVNKTCSTELTP